MKRFRSLAAFVAAGALVASLPAMWSCRGEDEWYYEEVPDEPAAVAGPSLSDGGSRACDVPTGVPPRALVLQSGTRTTELAAVDLETKEVAGRVTFDGGYGFTSSLGADPWFVSGVTNQVYRLDAREPWKAVATWDVSGDDARNAEDTNANPVAVVPVGCDKAYVLRFNRNKIAVIDPSATGGVPAKYIDLGPLVQAGDPSVVEMTAAAYDPARRRVYVLLGNADLSKTVTIDGVTSLLCAPLAPSIIAIDVDTDALVELEGAAPGKGIRLAGYNPPLGTPLVFDEKGDRLLVLEGGCSEDLGGQPGPMQQRRVEEVDLRTGAVKTLVSLDDKGFPSSLAFVDPTRAALAFYYDGYRWDPATPSLSPIAGQVDVVAKDGRGGLIGVRSLFDPDGGPATHEIVTIPKSGDPQVLATNPFSRPGGFIGGLEAWPHR